ncbi:MAG: LysR family transcriptional regulator, partial [Bdellovibrionales bacterium]|nr:LysR family transcriptional regulator [Bdellovibrionales bacterium]
MTSNKVFYIATTDIVEQMFMPQILKRLSKSAPNIGVRLIRWNPDLLPAQITNSEIDLAIGVRSFDMPILMRKVLYKETFVSAARSSHPLFKSKMKLEDFLSYPHTMTSSGDRVKGVVDSALEKLNSTRILTHTVSNFSSTPFVLENSDCILTAPRRFLLSLEKRRKIKVFEPPVTLPSFEIKLMWSKKYQKDSASVWMRELLYKTFNQVISNIEP